MTDTILNPALHADLTAQGFKHFHHMEDWTDYGTGETGPMVSYTPAYDEYNSDSETVYVDATGILHREARDLALEALMESGPPLP